MASFIDDSEYTYSSHTIDIRLALEDAISYDSRMDVLEDAQRDALRAALVKHIANRHYNLSRLRYYIRSALNEVEFRANKMTKVRELSEVLVPFIAARSAHVGYVDRKEYHQLTRMPTQRRHMARK